MALEPLEERTLLSITLNASSWTAIGPAPITGLDFISGGVTSGAGTGNDTGRVAGVAPDPNDPNTVYIAAANGGVWVTHDGGTDWTPLTDDLFDSQGNPVPLTMGAIALGAPATPGGPPVIYAGTGEANASQDSFSGVGILKSSDGGKTWAVEGEFDQAGNPLFYRRTISKIVVDPTNSNVVYATVGLTGSDGLTGNTGVWKSTDGGAHWTNTTTKIGTNVAFTDLVMNPQNPSVLFAAVGDMPGFAAGDPANGVYVTKDGGATWNTAGNFPGGATNGRTALAISNDGNNVYAAVTDPNVVGSATGGGLLKFEVSTDGGTTWNAVTPPNYLGTQGWYDTALAVDPKSPSLVYAAGVIDYTTGKNEVVASPDAGKTWIDVTADPGFQGPHTDHHALAFDSQNNLIDGNDGGVWKMNIPDYTKPAAFTWTNLNGNLNITAFTGVTLNPNDPNQILGGSQDDGTELYTGGLVWQGVWPGDGGYTAINYNNPKILYTENFGPSLERSTDGGQHWTDITPPNALNALNFNFYVPYAMSGSNPKELIYATDELDETLDGGNSWATIALPGQSGFNQNDSPIDAVAIAAGDPKWIYVSAGGTLYISKNGGSTWSQRIIPQATDGFNDIYIDPTNPKLAYITRGSYDNQTSSGKIFKTTDGGVTWTNITGNLPDIPAYSVASESLFGLVNKIFLGTKDGVYVSSDNGAHWNVMQTGMPHAQVVSLQYSPKLNILLAGTHGRGAWEILGDNVITATANASVPNGTEGVAATFGTLGTFVDIAGADPASGYTVNISWGDGVTDTGSVTATSTPGVFNIAGSHTYAEEGSYLVVLSIIDGDGGVGQTSTSIMVVDAPLASTGSSFSGVEGNPLTKTVASFTDANPNAPLSDFSATIVWGDGNTTTGAITFDSSSKTFLVSGSNNYLDEGSYKGTVTINDIGGSTTQASFTATIADAPLTDGVGATVASVEGATYSGPVFTFQDGNPTSTGSDFTATIVWGNGLTTTNAQVIATGSGSFSVNGSTVYADEGSYPITISVVDAGGQSIKGSTTAQVKDAPITGFVANFTGVEGQAIAANSLIGSFTDADPNAPISDYTVTIDFGDGVNTAVPGTITPIGGGIYNVSAGTTYDEEGTYTVTLNVVDVGGSTLSTTGTATIADAPLTSTAVNQTSNEGITLQNVAVADLTDGYTGATAADYIATVDWGDGTTTSSAVSTDDVTFTALGNGQFTINGTHAYAEPGSYTTVVTVTDKGGSTTTATGTNIVNEVPLSAGPSTTFTATEGKPFSGAVGTFTDPNTLSSYKDFFASVDWGDGTSSNAVISAGAVPGAYSVSAVGGGHTYTEETAPGQHYDIAVTVYDLYGAHVTLTGTATVQDAPIVATAGAAIKGLVEGSSYSGIIGTFTDAYAAAPSSDYSATIVWGDGFFTPGAIRFNPVTNVYEVSGSHIYSIDGAYTVTLQVNDVGGSRGSASTTATVADAPLINPAGTTVSSVAGSAFSGALGQFSDANTSASTSNFLASINWGDGTSSFGTISQPNGKGTAFTVSASHIYAKPGSFPIAIAVNDSGGSTTSITSGAHVLVPLTSSVTSSTTAGVTRNNRLAFAGGAQPGSTVKVFATGNNGTGATVLVGQTTANANGRWTISAGALPDGKYTFKVQMLDGLSGAIVQQFPVRPPGGQAGIQIDTSAPVVRSASFNPSSGQLKITLFDAGAGLSSAALYNRANYQLGFATQTGLAPLGMTHLTVTPGRPGSGLVTITATYNLGARIRPGTYVVTLNANGLADIAGNMLVERNFVTFPQAGNSPNPNYVAAFTVAPNLTASGPQQYIPLAEQIAAGNYSRNSKKGR
jgi:hypothetical protein